VLLLQNYWALGCPAACDPNRPAAPLSERDRLSAEFRELAMHGSVLPARKIAGQCDMHQLEHTSGRSALHKAAFWGHNDMVRYLVKECKLSPNVRDNYGDTPLHDAAKFGHTKVVEILLEGGADKSIKNNEGKDALSLAQGHGKHVIVELLKKTHSKL